MIVSATARRLDSLAVTLDLSVSFPALDRSNRLLLHAVAVVARDVLGRSWSEIGELLERDHSTAVHAAQRGRARVKSDADFADALAFLTSHFSTDPEEATQ